MDFWRSLSGTMEVELTSADPAGALLAMQRNAIEAEHIRKDHELQISFLIRRHDFSKLQQLAHNRADTLRIVKKSGIYWRLYALIKRPVLTIGLLIMLLFTLWVPGRIFFVQVQGNTAIPARQIAEAAAQCGITFGASRRDVRSEKMKNALMEAMPQLSWAGINTSGCTAVITVRERASATQEQIDNVVSSIVAVRDGVIRDMTVLRGSALCVTGQAVKKGQVLISGYTDCGISIQATCAAGEIYAETKHSQTVLMPTNFAYRSEKRTYEKNYSLIIGKKRIFFSNNSGISDTSCAKIYEEKYMTLPGGFILPIAVAVETWIYYETEDRSIALSEDMLVLYSKRYLTTQMLAGRIESASEQLMSQDGVLYLDGDYGCCEMIGVTRIEENILDYGKND